MKTLLHILCFAGLLWLMSILPYESWIVMVINIIAYWKLTSFK